MAVKPRGHFRGHRWVAKAASSRIEHLKAGKGQGPWGQRVAGLCQGRTLPFLPLANVTYWRSRDSYRNENAEIPPGSSFLRIHGIGSASRSFYKRRSKARRTVRFEKFVG